MNTLRVFRWLPFLLCIVAIGFVAPDRAEASDSDSGRPGYQQLRFEEDWSSFDPSAREDFFDPIKHVDLAADGRVWVSFGGELRARVEIWEDFGFDGSNDDTFLLGRGRLHADLHLGKYVRAFVSAISAYSTDRDLPGGRRTLDVDTIEPHNAFLDLRVPLAEDGDAVTLRLGRQEFKYGKQRLVSPLPWANALRSWDGARAILEHGDWRVDGFWARFTPVEKYDINDWHGGSDFYGVYAAGALPMGERRLGLDVYVLGLDKSNGVFNGSAGDEERVSIGARLGGAVGYGFDFDFEGTYQVGEVGTANVSAFSWASVVGFAPGDVVLAPRLEVGFDYASGDETPGDGDVETFNQLFPLGHAYFGILDVIGRQNAIDLWSSASIKPHRKLKLKLTGHFFWRASNDDAVYSPGGSVVRAGALSSHSEVGQEIDLVGVFKVDRHLTLEAGYGHFFTGSFLDDSGPSEDVDFGYVQAHYQF